MKNECSRLAHAFAHHQGQESTIKHTQRETKQAKGFSKVAPA